MRTVKLSASTAMSGVAVFSGRSALDNLEVSDVSRYMSELVEFMETRHPEVLKLLREKKDLTDDVRVALDQSLTEFKDVFRPSSAAQA